MHAVLIAAAIWLGGGAGVPPRRRPQVTLETAREFIDADAAEAAWRETLTIDVPAPELPLLPELEFTAPLGPEPPPDLDECEPMPWTDPRDRRTAAWLWSFAKAREPETKPAEAARPTREATTSPTPLAAENRPPRYPRRALAAGMQGRVVLQVRVNERGLVVACMVVQTSGHRILDRAASRAVAAWRFRNGPGVAYVPVRFVLRT